MFWDELSSEQEGFMVKYCSKCGQILDVSSNFCIRCGAPQSFQPVQPVQAPQSIQTAQPVQEPLQKADIPVRQPVMPQFHEPILFTTPVKVSRGLPPINTNCLQMMVVTPYRIIFAPFMPDTLSHVKAQAVAEAKQEGKGFFGRMSVSMKSDTRFYDTYKTKTLESIFLEHQNCYQIQNSWVQKVKFWKSRSVSDADGYGEIYHAVIMLIVNQVEIVITAERLDQDKETEQVLSAQFGAIFEKMRK
jgi:hypothetical protein